MPRMAYDCDRMTGTAQQLMTHADALQQQVEPIWKSIVQITEALPDAVAQNSSPNLDDYLSEMIPNLARIIGPRHAIATRLLAAAQAAQQAEGDNVPRHGHGPIPQ